MAYAKDISKEKHEIVLFYNSTKANVDTVRRIMRYYSCRIKATGILRELLRRRLETW